MNQPTNFHFHCLRHPHSTHDAHVCCLCLRTIPKVWTARHNSPVGPVCRIGPIPRPQRYAYGRRAPEASKRA
jgi:hypothetical protein